MLTIIIALIAILGNIIIFSIVFVFKARKKTYKSKISNEQKILPKKANGIRYSFTFKELKYIHSNDKKCPKCNTKINEEKGFVLRDGTKLDYDSDYSAQPKGWQVLEWVDIT